MFVQRVLGLKTPSEIQMFKLLGGTVVGMTGIPEAVLFT